MKTILALACVAALGCGDDDGGADVGTGDTGGSDTGTTDTGGTDTGGTDTGGTDTGPDSGVCDGAAEDEPCTAEGVSCGGELCTDECSFCNILRCEGGMWTRLEAFPAPCFSCGPELQCPLDTNLCSVFLPGMAGSDPSYNCSPIPEACRAEPSCECLRSEGISGDCSGDAETGFTVTLAAP